MTWLKLVTKALFWMQLSSDRYPAKVNLKPHDSAAKESKLSLPLTWFRGPNAPAATRIELSPSHLEQLPLPKQN